MPVITLFFQENGLTLHDIFLLQAIFSLFVLVLDIPTGYFADIFTRRASLLVGGVILSLGWAVYAISFGFWGFLIAEIILGVGVSFVSSADSAMLHDTLKAISRENEYGKQESKNQGFGLYSEAVSSVIGGFLAIVSLRLPLIIDIFTTALIIPLAYSLTEPAREKIVHQKSHLKEMMEVVRYALFGHKEVGLLILYYGFVSASTLTMVWFSQPYLMASELPIGYFGIVWSGLLLMTGFLANRADRIERYFGRKNALVILWLLPVLGYTLAGTFMPVWGFVFLICFYVTRGVINPVILDYTNKLISSDIRATVLSVKGVPVRLIFMVLGPGVSWIGEVYSLQIALLVTGGTFFVFGGGVIFLMHRARIL
jgi:MFS family permease